MNSSHPPVYRPTYAEISLSALGSNATWLKSISPKFFCPMLKSNAYGHGDVETAKTLSKLGIKTFGLALVEEACRLRAGGLHTEELLVFGCFDPQGADEILRLKLTPVLSLIGDIELLQSKLPEGAEYPVHLKFNTGMARLGFEMHEASEVKRLIEQNKKLKVIGVCSHLSHGEDASLGAGHSQRQMEQVESLKNLFGSDIPYHLLNSSGALSLWAHGKKNLAYGFRPGIALYGVPPEVQFNTAEAQEKWKSLPLKPVMRLRSGVITYHHLKPGESVSYGGIWTASRPSVIGVVPIGYADGYTRRFSNRGQMLFRGKRVPVIGRVCMDYTMVDLTEVLGTEFGNFAEEIVLIGAQEKECLTAGEVADWSDTVSYEILTSVGRRVPRKYVD